MAFCERLYPQVVGTLTLVVGDRMTAEELAQETFVKVWQRWDHVRTMDSPEGWTHHVGMNLARSWLRRRAAARRAQRRLESDAAVQVPDVDRDDVLAVREALAALPRRQREAIVLRYYAGLDVAATAEAMGCPPGTVTALCHRARAAMRTDIVLPAETS